MQDMDQRLPLPNPDEWMTVAAAAALLGVHQRTVLRMIRARLLVGYTPVPAVGERPVPMLWTAEVERIREARKIAGMARA